jgi:hypothetical protein
VRVGILEERVKQTPDYQKRVGKLRPKTLRQYVRRQTTKRWERNEEIGKIRAMFISAGKPIPEKYQP